MQTLLLPLGMGSPPLGCGSCCRRVLPGGFPGAEEEAEESKGASSAAVPSSSRTTASTSSSFTENRGSGAWRWQPTGGSTQLLAA